MSNKQQHNAQQKMLLNYILQFLISISIIKLTIYQYHIPKLYMLIEIISILTK